MSKEIAEAIKKAAGSLSKEEQATIDKIFGLKPVSEVLEEGLTLKSQYSKKTQALAEEKKQLEQQIKTAVETQKTSIESQLKADYDKKVKEVENFKNLVAQQAGMQLQQEQARAFQLQQEIQRANQQMQGLISEVAPYDDGVKILAKLGLTGFQGYGTQLGLPSQQGQGYGYNNGFQQGQQPFNNGFQAPQQNPYGQQNYGYQNGQGQQGFQPQQQPKPLTIEEILAGIMPKIQETYAPNLNGLAQLPFEIQQMANEHFHLTGEHLNTKLLYDKAIAANGAKTPTQIWEEDYDIPTKRSEASAKAESDRIEALVKTRLDEEKAKQTFPSEKPVDYALSNSSYFGEDKSASSSESEGVADRTTLEGKSYVGEAMNALAVIQQGAGAK